MQNDSELTKGELALLQVKKDLADALHQKSLVEARSTFYMFVRLVAHLMLDGDTYRDGKHIRAIATTLQDVEENQIDRLMLMLAPGSMKSVLLMLFAAWCMGRHQSWRVMWISHTTDKAEECSGRIRDLVRSSEFQEIFPTFRIRDDKSGVTLWKLVTGGSFMPAGAGKSIAGYRYNLGILDDPLSEQTAKSDAERGKINKWFGPGFRSRKLPESKIILVNTRWHTLDLSGYLLNMAARNKRADQWELISIPAILDKASAEYLDLPEGGSYWPEFITMEDLLKTRESLAREDWLSLYLQTPIGEEGNIFTKGDFMEWQEDEPPECDEIIQTLDTAFSEKTRADFSVIETWGIFHKKVENEDGDEVVEAHVILLNVEMGRWSYPELRRQAQLQYKKFLPDRIIVEEKASGQSLIQDMRLNKLPVVPYQPDRDKLSRAHAVAGVVERHRVWLPLRKKFAAALLQEALEFPKGAHDDQVDAMVMALLYLRRRYNLTVEVVEKEQVRRVRVRNYWKGAVNARRAA